MNSKRAFNHFFAGIGLTYGFFEYAREEMADQIDEYQEVFTQTSDGLRRGYSNGSSSDY